MKPILEKIEEENGYFLLDNKIIMTGFVPNRKKRVEYTVEEHKEEEADDFEDFQEKVQIDIESSSYINKTSNYLIKFFYLLLPFKNGIKIIRSRYNSTILLLFKIYRFLVFVSFFSFFIFLYECIYHIVEVNKEKGLKETCKYGIPCFFQYSSFSTKEAKVFSTTYGIWYMFFAISFFIYYYILNSENEEKDIYFKNNKGIIAGSYLFTSYNFNNVEEYVSKINKEIISNELKIHSYDFIQKLNGNNANECLNHSSIGRFIIFNLLYFVYLFFYFSLFFLIFVLRDLLRNKSKLLSKFKFMDVIADLVSFALVPVLFKLFNLFTGLFSVFENWIHEYHENISYMIKKLITNFIGFFSLIFIFTDFTLYTNELKDKISIFGSTNPTLFGCQGKFSDRRHTYHNFTPKLLNRDYQLAKSSSYSKCREEEVGIDLLFIFVIYFIANYIIELFKNCINCCRGNKQKFDPVTSMVKVFTTLTFYLICMYFIPYLAILFPLVSYILLKSEYSLLNKRGSYFFKDSGISNRSNKKILLILFLIFIIELLAFQGYFYLLSFPHFYKVNCYVPNNGIGDAAIMLYDYSKKLCGPIRPHTRASDILTNLVYDTTIIGWIFEKAREMPFIIVVISMIFIVIIYRHYNPEKVYYDYLKGKQNELNNTFRVFYEHIAKKDSLSLLLIDMAKKDK